MATTSPFDPDKVDPEFYSNDPNQHGDSDFGRQSEGVGTNAYKDSTSGMDMDTENRDLTHDTREANRGEGRLDRPVGENYGSTEGWDVEPESVNDSDQPKERLMSDEAASQLSKVAENPSDDALFHRSDATYLEEGDNPNEGYDPHHVGYEGKDKSSSQ